MVSMPFISAACCSVPTPLVACCVCPVVHAVMERELEKIQKNTAAVVAHVSVPEEAKKEIGTSVDVSLTEQPHHMYIRMYVRTCILLAWWIPLCLCIWYLQWSHYHKVVASVYERRPSY